MTERSGVDIGSSTSHLLVSTITLERLDTRYVVTGREVRFALQGSAPPPFGGDTDHAGGGGG